MDARTRTQLEELRRRVPRYLFRGWRNSSGGDRRLNTTMAITPRAFLNRRHTTVYDLTAGELTHIVIQHIRWKDFPTVFSSWSASLSVALAFCTLDDDSAHVSIVDTSKLWDSNQIFHVPDLHFLTEVGKGLAKEYLAYGIIDGDNHRALPYKLLRDADVISLRGLPVPSGPGFDRLRGTTSAKSIPVTGQQLLRCRRVGEQYGPQLSMPMTLALISRLMVQCNPPWDIRRAPPLCCLIEQTVKGIPIHRDWQRDEAIISDIVFIHGLPEVEQFINLLRHFAQNLPDERNDKAQVEEAKEVEEEEDAAGDEKGLKKRRIPASSSDAILRKPKGITKVTKQKSGPHEDTQATKLKKGILLEKQLEINMNRYGKKAHNSKNEEGILAPYRKDESGHDQDQQDQEGVKDEDIAMEGAGY